MSLEENKAIVRKVIEAINKQNLSSLDELIATDFVYHMPVEQIQGLEVMKQDIEEEIKAFPDWHETIEDILAEGDKVCFRVKLTGTHTGEYYGLAPTGKKITYTAVAICRIVDGKIVEGWGVYDMLDFYKQLGIIEYTEKGKKLFPEEAK